MDTIDIIVSAAMSRSWAYDPLSIFTREELVADTFDIKELITPDYYGMNALRLNCYEYQTCERTDGRNYVWEQVVTRTRRNVATRWAEEAGAKWEWTREKAAEQMAALRVELHEQYLAAK
jgi:hypothetical protein